MQYIHASMYLELRDVANAGFQSQVANRARGNTGFFLGGGIDV